MTDKEYHDKIEIIYNACKNYNIPCRMDALFFGGWGIRFPWCNGDIACDDFTDEHDNGMVESLGFPWDGLFGTTTLSTDQAIKKIVAFYLIIKLKNLDILE